MKNKFIVLTSIDLLYNEKIFKISKSDIFSSLLFDLYNRKVWFEAELQNNKIVSVTPISYKGQARLDAESLKLRGGNYLYPDLSTIKDIPEENTNEKSDSEETKQSNDEATSTDIQQKDS
jgi:hypothetical protein